MSTFEGKDQSIDCKDCESEFVFSAEDQKAFEEKGYENSPVRCDPCRKNRLEEVATKRRGGSRKPYHAPLPEPAGLVKDNVTFSTGGKIVYSSRGYGFIEYDGGQVHFSFTNFEGEKSLCRPGCMVDFVCSVDEKDRVDATRVVPNGEPNAYGEREKPRAPRARKSAPRDPAAAPKEKVQREMIDIQVQCDGKETVTVHKPVERATFQVFRRLIIAAHKDEIKKNFRLFYNGEVLTYGAFNSLVANDVVTCVEIAETEEA